MRPLGGGGVPHSLVQEEMKHLSNSLVLPHADVAPPDVPPLLPALGQCGGGIVVGACFHSGQPETVDVGEVVAGSSRPLTLHEGLGPEVCQTAT